MPPRTAHADSRTWSNFVPAELVKLCGVHMGRWPVYVLKELVDNAVAALEEHGVRNPMVWVHLDRAAGMITVSDNGPGISDAALSRILDFDSFGGSNRHYKLPTRGAQGNAFMTLVGIVSAWLPQEPHLLVQRPCGPGLSLEVALDHVRQRVDIQRMEVGPAGRSAVGVPVPELPWKRGGSDWDELESVARTMAWVNPHVTFIMSFESGTHAFASVPGAGPALPEHDVACGSAEWFTSEEFAQRMAADVRARPSTTLARWLSEFRGVGRGTHQWGGTQLGALTANWSEALFAVNARELRQWALRSSDTKRCREPRFEAVGPDRLGAYLVDEAGADAGCPVQYHSVRGGFQTGDAHVPFLVEVALAQMPEGSRNAPEPVLCMNRTVLYGSPTFKAAQWREKVRGDWKPLNGDLGAFARAYQVDHGTTPCAIVVHVTCPSPGYAGMGKQQFDTTWLAGPLSECMERVTLQVRRQRAGESRRGPKREDSANIRETVFKLAPEVWESATRGGRHALMIRQFYYSVRKVWHLHHDKKLEYGTFCAYVAEWEESVGRYMCLRDPRGTMIEPHSGRSLRLGTDEVAKFKPRKWEGHTLIFVEKEGFAHLLRDYGILKRYDAIVIGSKGFAVESCREVLQAYKRLLGGAVKIVALHDADPAGYMIGRDLATNLPRFGENVAVNVLDVGLTVREARQMGLQDEPFSLKKPVWSMVRNMRTQLVDDPRTGQRRPMLDQEAWDAFMPPMMRQDEYPSWVDEPEGMRVELNAMEPEQFIRWLEGHLEQNECKKVRPPDDVVNEVVMQARANKVNSEVGAALMRVLGDGFVKTLLEELGTPQFDLDAQLAGKPEQSWEYLSQRAGQSGIDLGKRVEEMVRAKMSGAEVSGG